MICSHYDVQIQVIRLQHITQNENHRMDVTPLEGILQSAIPHYTSNKIKLTFEMKKKFSSNWRVQCPAMKREVVTHRFLVSVTNFSWWNVELHASAIHYHQHRQCSHDGNILPAVLNSIHCQSYLITWNEPDNGFTSYNFEIFHQIYIISFIKQCPIRFNASGHINEPL